MSVRHFVGLDLGQARDFSAIADVERTEYAAGVDAGTRAAIVGRRYALRFLERCELRTPYPQVVARASEVCAKLWGSPERAKPELIVDGTGVGRVVVDLLRPAPKRSLLDLGAPYVLVPVTIVSGFRAQVGDDGFIHVPKRDLAGSLVVMFERGELAIAAGLPLADVLVHELLNFGRKISDAGNESFGNWREAKNDDLVLAVALACWRASLKAPPPVQGTRRLIV